MVTMNAKKPGSDKILETPFTPFRWTPNGVWQVWSLARCDFQYYVLYRRIMLEKHYEPDSTMIVSSDNPSSPASTQHVALPFSNIKSSFCEPGNLLHPGPSIFERSLAFQETRSLAPRFSYA